MTTTAISGTRRAMKELVDGTIRVQIDIDPIYRADFHRLFPEIDMAVALTPLRESPPSAAPDKAVAVAAATKPAGYPPGLTGLAVQWCQDERFHDWLREVHRGEWMATACDPAYQLPEATAKRVILALCQISSRKELDTNPEAAERFETLIRQPFRKVLAEE